MVTGFWFHAATTRGCRSVALVEVCLLVAVSVTRFTSPGSLQHPRHVHHGLLDRAAAAALSRGPCRLAGTPPPPTDTNSSLAHPPCPATRPAAL